MYLFAELRDLGRLIADILNDDEVAVFLEV